MNYYKRHIGDYAKKAGRLSMLEHGAYTLLLDACYDRERFPTEDEAIEWAWARTDEEINAVKFVLKRFFTLQDGVYVQKHIEEALQSYAENCATNARIATDREEKRAERARTVQNRARKTHEAPPSEHEAPPNHKPLTINQEPVKEQELRAQSSPAVLAVMAMKAGGCIQVNPSQAQLLEALAEGVTPEQLRAVAELNPGKGQSYIVAAALGQFRDARAKPRVSVNVATRKTNAIQPSPPGTYGEDEPLPGLLQ